MDRHVAALRGMNLGGRRIANEDLRSHFAALDLKAIGTILGLTTIRTKGTIDQIAAKHFG